MAEWEAAVEEGGPMVKNEEKVVESEKIEEWKRRDLGTRRQSDEMKEFRRWCRHE